MQDPWVGKIPWRRKWQPTPVILPGEFHGQGSLAGYSPWGCKESGKTEQLSLTYAHENITTVNAYTCPLSPKVSSHPIYLFM